MRKLEVANLKKGLDLIKDIDDCVLEDMHTVEKL